MDLDGGDSDEAPMFGLFSDGTRHRYCVYVHVVGSMEDGESGHLGLPGLLQRAVAANNVLASTTLSLIHI